MNNQNNISIRQIINSYIKDIPKKDLEYCLIDCLKKSESFVKFNQTYILNDKEIKNLNKLLFELKLGKPLSYVLGYHPFYKHEFYVDKNVLIPRNETEIVIDEILKVGDHYFKKYNKLTIIDLGTGSGCIGLSLAIERPEWDVILIDKFLSITEILEKNIKKFSLSNVSILMSDWLSAVIPNSVDIIIANPPYVEYDSPDLDQTVKLYEPHTALFSEDNGYKDLKKIIKQAKHKLRKGGTLLMENGFNQSEEVKKYLVENEYKDINILLDYNKIQRFTKSKV